VVHEVSYDTTTSGVATCLCSWRGVPIIRGGYVLCPVGVAQEEVDEPQHKLGRNDPCWCGSGKKFKKCHGR
jgi:hypothetical protein